MFHAFDMHLNIAQAQACIYTYTQMYQIALTKTLWPYVHIAKKCSAFHFRINLQAIFIGLHSHVNCYGFLVINYRFLKYKTVITTTLF